MLVGPNCAGIISPGKAMLGIMPGHIYQPGNVGVISRSGTLGYEAAAQMKELGIGISTASASAATRSTARSFLDISRCSRRIPDTHAVLMIGEIGGPQEAEASAWIKREHVKPVIGLRGRAHGAEGPPMGHAGAIISAFGDSAAEKAEIMRTLRPDRRARSGRVRPDRRRGSRQDAEGGLPPSSARRQRVPRRRFRPP